MNSCVGEINATYVELDSEICFISWISFNGGLLMIVIQWNVMTHVKTIYVLVSRQLSCIVLWIRGCLEKAFGEISSKNPIFLSVVTLLT